MLLLTSCCSYFHVGSRHFCPGEVMRMSGSRQRWTPGAALRATFADEHPSDRHLESLHEQQEVHL